MLTAGMCKIGFKLLYTTEKNVAVHKKVSRRRRTELYFNSQHVNVGT